jgi:hypothetical protein
MSVILARSLGPKLMSAVLDGHGNLNHPRDPVTFLAEVEPADPESCDAWNYGCGTELGVFVLVETNVLTLHRDPLRTHGHDPHAAPHHVYVTNAADPLPFESAVYVGSPEEMGVAAECVTVAAAADSLKALRGGRAAEGIIEEAIDRARRLARQLDNLAALQEALIRTDSPRQLEDRLRRAGLNRSVLEVHPEHLSRSLRAALEQIASDISGGQHGP